MSSLSNFLRRSNDRQGLEVRHVKRQEIERALELILAGSTSLRIDDAVNDFRQMAASRNLDLTTIWVAVDASGTLHWACYPMTSPGKTMLLMVPTRLRPGMNATHVAELLAAACLDAQQQGIQLAQVLVDPSHRAVHRALIDSGFADIAELVYLIRDVQSPIGGRIMSPDLRLWRYDRSTHYRFARAIENSYIDSLDCPALTGKRETEDIIAGHKSTGDFDPELWILLSDVENNDLGVLLLNRLHRSHGYELVYLGLAPSARGKGYADTLLRVAINNLANEGGGSILTACDADNTPARKLYHRNGFGHMYTRKALGRSLPELLPQSMKVIATTQMILSKQGRGGK